MELTCVIVEFPMCFDFENQNFLGDRWHWELKFVANEVSMPFDFWALLLHPHIYPSTPLSYQNTCKICVLCSSNKGGSEINALRMKHILYRA